MHLSTRVRHSSGRRAEIAIHTVVRHNAYTYRFGEGGSFVASRDIEKSAHL